jgi:hypothetical protein
MAHLITSDDYRFGRTHGKRVSVRARVNGFLKNMIEAIADSKMRRIERELALRGYLFDRSNNDWVSCDSSRAGIHKD